MKKLIVLLACVFASCGHLYAQGSFSPPATATKTSNGLLAPGGGATITVCAAGAIGEPCSPVLTGALFLDQALTQPLSNPFTADASGNYQFAAATGTYTVTVTGTNLPGLSYQVVLGSGSGGGGTSGITGCTAVGGVSYQNGTANTLTCGSGFVYSGGLLDLNSSSTGTPTALYTVRGHGFGLFTPNNNTALVNFQQESYATANYGLMLTNKQAGNSSALFFGVSDAGLATLCGGGAVSDANKNFGCFNWDPLSGVVLTGSTVSPNVTKNIFNIQGTPGQTGHLLNFLNSSAAVLSYFDAAGIFRGGSVWTACGSRGLGDGLNTIAAGTYLQFACVNDSGVTVTILGIHCWTDNAGTSSLNAANNAGTSLLTGAVTCNNTKTGGGAAGTQSATVTLAAGDAINFTFVA